MVERLGVVMGGRFGGRLCWWLSERFGGDLGEKLGGSCSDRMDDRLGKIQMIYCSF